jgi:hypothetical protein
MSFITVPGRDIIVIDEQSYEDDVSYDYKVHIIRLKFDNPTDDKMQWVMDTFRKTNRYVIDTVHIRYYNYYLKRTNLKYYIINTLQDWKGIVTFFKKNNKVLFDITKLSDFERLFVMNVALEDVLSNTEVILINKEDFTDKQKVFEQWRGDVIIQDDNYPI